MKARQHSSVFKEKLASEVIREEGKISELSKKYDLHPRVVKRWKIEALAGLVQVFEKGISPVKTGVRALHMGLTGLNHFSLTAYNIFLSTLKSFFSEIRPRLDT